MRTYLDCVPCFVRQGLSALREVCDDELEIDRILKLVLQEIAAFERHKSPPEMAQAIHGLIRRELGSVDPYHEIKQRSTRQALAVVSDVRHRITASVRPFHTAVRFSIAGNILDFALASLWDEGHLKQKLAQAESQPLDEAAVDQLQRAVAAAQTVLILGDNAGEAVFDRLLVEQMPGKQVTYAVKAEPVINDATRADALDAGMDEVAEIIDNGTDAPGTVLDQCSPEFVQRFDQADVVIAKGQANFETLNEVEREVFFLTQIKCPVIADHYQRQVGDWLVTTPAALAQEWRAQQGDVA